MKKITSAILFFVVLAFSVKGQCPSQPQMVMIAEDTNTVFNVGQGNNNTIPATISCTSMAFCVYPQIWSSTNSASIYQPCIKTRYRPYWTSVRNNVTESFFQNGGLIQTLAPGNPLPDRIGGSVPPANNGLTSWDYSLFQLSTAYTHSISVCKTGAGAIVDQFGVATSDSISIRDCWRNNTPFIYASNPNFVTASPCLTWSDPANSGTLGTTAWTISPAAVWPAIYAWTNGMCYIDPRYLPPATYTLNYSFTPPAGVSACGTYTANYVFTVTNPYTATWTAPTNLCSNSACVNLPPTVSGTAGGTWSGSGVSGSQFCPSTVGAGSWPVTYTVGISSACGATQTNSITVTATPTLSITGNTSICSGQSTVLTGGTATNYTWMPGSVNTNTISVSPTSATTYTLTGANGNCTAVQTVALIVTATPTLSVAGGSICSGQSIVLTNTGSAASGYTWSPSGGSAGSATVSPTSNTTYTLAGNNGACTGTTTATVNVTQTPTLSITGSGTVCAGGSVVLTGGTATNYTWSPSGGNASTATVTPGGTTTYTLTGANGTCTSTATAAVNVTPNPTVGISSSGGATICSGTSTTLTASGATNYTWSPNAGGGTTNPVVVSPTSSDTYTVTGESSGCTSTQVITVNVTPTPTVLASAGSGTLCAGQSTVLTASGASNYTWMPGGVTTSTISVNPGSTQVYTVTGDNAGCISSQTVVVNINPLPTIGVNAAPSSLCVGQTTTITASGANTYTWSANAGGGTSTSVTVTPGSSDTYTVTGTDVNGCVNSNTITVSVGSGAVITISATSNTVCSGGSITLNGSGATSYTWAPGGQTTGTITVTPSGSTTYTLTGDNGGGCIGTETVSVNVIPTPTVSTSASSGAICSGQSTVLTGSGATNYTWMPGGATTNTISVNPGSSTTYTLTGETTGCISTSTVAVNVTATPTVTANASGGTICAGQNVVLTGGGAGSYTWNPGGMTTGTVTVTPGSSTTYTLTGANGACTATETVTVNVTALPNITANASSNSICTGQSAVLTAGGGTTYTWMPGGATTSTISVTPGSTQVYTVTGSASGCDNTAQVSITVNATPTVAVSATSGTICAGQSTTLNGSGATSYTWNPGGSTSANTTVSPTSSTTYTLIGDNGGCTDTTMVNVVVNPTPTLGNTALLDSARCGASTGGVLGITVTGGTPGYTYQWSNGSTNDSLLNVPMGTYSVVVTDANGCVATGGVSSFTVPGSSAVTAGLTPPITTGQAPLNVTFTGTASTGTTTVFGWDFGNGTTGTGSAPTSTYNAPGTYSITMIAYNGGCLDTAYAVVIVDMPTIILIPNIFSPNGDGLNDNFFIFNTGLTSLNCEIYNRWGQLMYTITAPQGVWDGKANNGNEASDGTYYAIIKAVAVDGTVIEKEGYITLVR